VEAGLRASHVLIPLAAVPAGVRSRSGIHGIAIDGAGRPRLDDAWREP
jgi:hypothetical protein